MGIVHFRCLLNDWGIRPTEISAERVDEGASEIFKYHHHFYCSMEIKIVLDGQEEGGFTVYVPSLPGCVSQGDSVDDALNNIKEAIELHLETEVSNIAGEGRIMNIEI